MKKFAFLCILATICSSGIAQDTVYFSKKTTPSSSTKKRKSSSEQNVIKISPLSFLWGYVPVYYERQINSFFSIQAGVGITTRNYFKSWVESIDEESEFENATFAWNSPNGDDLYNILKPYDYKYRESKIGYYLSLQPKIYFNSEALDDSYVGISVDYFHYANQHKKIVPGTTNGGPKFGTDTFKEHEKYFTIMANFGMQSIYDRVAVDYMFGIGLRKVKSKHYAVADDWSSSEFIDGTMSNDQAKLAVNISIMVGLHY